MTASPGSPALPPYIGRYRVLRRIGKGAMGAVFSALDEQLGRRVAVKLMLADFTDDPELRERFHREARITGQLAHRNIVTVFDLGEDDGRPFIVMELLEGQPLNDFLTSDAASTIDAKIDLMMQLCDGLQNAHQAGVVHRDIKPTNVHVLPEGTLKLLDFGVARLAASNLTASGMLLGTPEYMSPEQARGQPLDARTDVFSAAAVFHFMLSGRPPFGNARDLRKVLHGIISEPPEALTDNEAPEALRHVLAKAMAKAPADRYQQCAEMRADLEHVRRSLGAATQRLIQAARERYRLTLEVIEERRVLGRALGMADVEASCNEAAVRVRSRFSAFAVDPHAPIEPADRVVATAALEALQARHNAEQAALEALRERAADALRSAPSSGDAKPRAGFWRGLFKGPDN